MEDLGWRFEPTNGDADWNGLTEHYEALWRLVGEPPGDHLTWMRLFGSPGHKPTPSRPISRQSTAPPRIAPWTEAQVLERLGEGSIKAREVGERLLEWAHERTDLTLSGTSGAVTPKVAFRVAGGGGSGAPLWRLVGNPQDLVEISLGVINRLAPYTDPAVRRGLHSALTPLARMAKGDPDREEWAYADLPHLSEEAALSRLIALLGEVVDRIGRGR